VFVTTRPTYIPAEALDWAEEHADVLDLVVSELLREGTWPTTTDLTRRLAREDRPLPLERLLSSMPKSLGFVENHPGRIVLLLFGLRLTADGVSLVRGFFSMLERAIALYKGPDNPPILTRDDVRRVAGDEPYLRALSDIIVREAPFLGSGSGGPDDEWSREVTSVVVHYWTAAAFDDYLEIRATELGQSPQFGFSAPASAASPRAHPPSSSDGIRDVFISHASEDKDAIARPLADELLTRGWSVWFDEYELVLGDSLRRKIDSGLARSRVGVVVLSHAFFEKEWPQRELDGLTARLMAGENNVIVPIWHELTADDLLAYSPPLADLLAGKSSDGPVALATEVERVLARRQAAPMPDDGEAQARVFVSPATREQAVEDVEGAVNTATVEGALPAEALPRVDQRMGPSFADREGDDASPGAVHDATIESLQVPTRYGSTN
jgi:hypothetical protein